MSTKLNPGWTNWAVLLTPVLPNSFLLSEALASDFPWFFTICGLMTLLLWEHTNPSFCHGEKNQQQHCRNCPLAPHFQSLKSGPFWQCCQSQCNRDMPELSLSLILESFSPSIDLLPGSFRLITSMFHNLWSDRSGGLFRARSQINNVTGRQERNENYPWLFIFLL